MKALNLAGSEGASQPPRGRRGNCSWCVCCVIPLRDSLGAHHASALFSELRRPGKRGSQSPAGCWGFLSPEQGDEGLLHRVTAPASAWPEVNYDGE